MVLQDIFNGITEIEEVNLVNIILTVSSINGQPRVLVGVKISVAIPIFNSSGEGVYTKLRSVLVVLKVPRPPVQIPELV
jgi:hypothetical protein